MSKPILVFIETRNGQIKRPSLEALSEGRRMADTLGSSLTALVAGSAVSEAAQKLASFGPDSIVTFEHELLEHYHPEPFAELLASAAGARESAYVLLAATSMGRDLGARAAARLETGMASDCTQVTVENGEVRVRRPVFSGKAIATVRFTKLPAFISLRPNVFPAAEREGGSPTIEKLELELDPSRIRARTVRVESTEGTEVDVTEASIVVSGGRAMKGPENFDLIRGLARALGGAVGATRAAVDAGWIDHQYQIGQTGKVVSPTLYIACGISGAIQHLAGMSTSKVIVAINKDPEAPIFKVADYGIVGDLYEIIPKFTEEVRKLKAQ